MSKKHQDKPIANRVGNILTLEEQLEMAEAHGYNHVAAMLRRQISQQPSVGWGAERTYVFGYRPLDCGEEANNNG